MALAAGGNTNLQFLSNKFGAVEYTTGYLGKVYLPDTKISVVTNDSFLVHCHTFSQFELHAVRCRALLINVEKSLFHLGIFLLLPHTIL